MCYYKGEGIEKSTAKAAQWWTKAAAQGHSEAQTNLGLCYYKGNGIEKDKIKAVHWWKKAAEQGESAA